MRYAGQISTSEENQTCCPAAGKQSQMMRVMSVLLNFERELLLGMISCAHAVALRQHRACREWGVEEVSETLNQHQNGLWLLRSGIGMATLQCSCKKINCLSKYCPVKNVKSRGNRRLYIRTCQLNTSAYQTCRSDHNSQQSQHTTRMHNLKCDRIAQRSCPK